MSLAGERVAREPWLGPHPQNDREELGAPKAEIVNPCGPEKVLTVLKGRVPGGAAVACVARSIGYHDAQLVLDTIG